MTYHAATRGLGPYGIPDGEPRVACDDCGTVLYIRTRRGGPPKWLLDGKAPPKWRGGRRDDGTRWDKCPRCIAQETES